MNFGVATVVTVKVLVFWDVTPCSLVKVSLVTCHEGTERGVEVQLYSFTTSALEQLSCQHHPCRFTPGKVTGDYCTGHWVGLGTLLDGHEKSRFTRFRIPDRPARTAYAIPAAM